MLPLFLETNVVAILAVTIAGEKVTNEILTNLVRRKVTVTRNALDSVFDLDHRQCAD